MRARPRCPIFPEDGEEAFPVARVEHMGEDRLDVGNTPQLALSLLGFFLFRCHPYCVLTPVCRNNAPLAVIPTHPHAQRPFSHPRVSEPRHSRRGLLPLHHSVRIPSPPPPSFSPQLNGPSSPPSVNERPIHLLTGCVPWSTNVHEAPYIFSSRDSLTSPAINVWPASLWRHSANPFLADALPLRPQLVIGISRRFLP